MGSEMKSNVLKMSTKSVATGILKTELNAAYRQVKNKFEVTPQREHFDYLWDLKEKAIIEGKSTVEVPEEWLTELEASASLYG